MSAYLNIDLNYMKSVFLYYVFLERDTPQILIDYVSDELWARTWTGHNDQTRSQCRSAPDIGDNLVNISVLKV